MIYYAIRHIRTQLLMPEVTGRRGYSHWNPDNPNMPKKLFTNIPRLLSSNKQAKKCIAQWNAMPNSCNSFDYEGECDIDIKNDGRKKEDLEVIKMELRIRK